MKASKQKILKLREELKEKQELKNDNTYTTLTSVGNLGLIDPSKMAMLKEAFDSSRRRAEEVLSSDELNLYLKVHGQRASKLYSALSTLIYSSIGLSKADELEQYIKKAATQVPSNLFDIDEWIHVIAIAKEVRSIDSVAARDEITLLRKNLNILHFVSAKPLKNSREELQLLKKDVVLQMQVMQQDLLKGKELILLLTTKLRDMVDKSGIEKIKEDNKELRATYVKEFDRMQHFTDSMISKQKDDSERQRLQHREVLANMSAAHRSDIKSLKEQMRDIEDENYKKIQQLQDEVNSLSKNSLNLKSTNLHLQAKSEGLSSDLSAALLRANTAEGTLGALNERLAETIANHAEAINSLHMSAVADRLAESTTASVVSKMIINAHEKKIKDLEVELKEKKSRIFDLEGESMLLYERVEQLTVSEDTNEKSIKALTANITEATVGFQHYKEMAEKLEVEVQGERAATNTFRTSLSELQTRFDSTAAELQGLKESSASMIENLTAQLREETRLHGDFKQLSDDLQATIAKLQAQAETDAAAASAEIAKLKSAVAELQVELQKSAADREVLRSDGNAKAKEISELKAELVVVAVKLAERSDSLAAAHEDIITLKLKIERLETTGSNQLQELSGLQQRNHNLQMENAQLNTNLALSAEKFHHLQENFDHMSTQNEKLTTEAHDVLLENKDLHKRLLELHLKNDLLRDRVDEVTSNLEVARRRVQEVEIDALQSRSSAEVECVDLKKKLQDLNANMAEAIALNVALTQEMGQLKEEVATHQKKASSSAQELNRSKQDLAGMQLKNKKLEDEVFSKATALNSFEQASVNAPKEKVELTMAEKFTEKVISGVLSSMIDFKAVEKNSVENLENARKENSVFLEKIKALEDLLLKKDSICDDQKKIIASLKAEIDLLMTAARSEVKEIGEIERVKLYSRKVAESSITAAMKTLTQKSMLRISINSHSQVGIGPPISSARSLTRISPRYTTLNHQAQMIALGTLKSEIAERSRLKSSASSIDSPTLFIADKNPALKPEDFDNQSIETFQTNEMETPFPASPTPIIARQPFVFRHGIVPIVLIQKVARGFIARCRAARFATEAAAREQGVLAAYRGTRQGETGWYRMNDLLFYFCLNEGEYYLLCGPLQVDAFEAAKQELVADKSVERIFGKFPLCFRLDRLGLHATRMQIEILLGELTEREKQIVTLTSEAAERDGIIVQMQEEFRVFQKELDLAAQSNYGRYQSQIDEQAKKMKDLSDSIIVFEKERALLQSQFNNLRLLSAEVGIAPTLVEVRIKALNIGENRRKFTRLTAVARGYLGRMRVKKLLLFKLSKQTGVLVAMKNTIQGETGWYVAPDRSIFYFILKNNEWLHAVGPLSEQEFDLNRAQVKQKQRNFHPSVLTPVPYSVVDYSDDVFDYGTLCISNKLEKLFVALPLDILIPSLLSRQGSRMSRSSSINSTHSPYKMYDSQHDSVPSVGASPHPSKVLPSKSSEENNSGEDPFSPCSSLSQT